MVAIYAYSGSTAVILGAVVVYRLSFLTPQPTNETSCSNSDHFSSVSVYFRERNATGTSYCASVIYVAATKPTPSHADGYIIKG